MWTETNKFTAGEKDIGSFATRAECLQAALVQCPNHDLVNVPTGSLTSENPGSCWCQHSKGEDSAAYNSGGGWSTCRMREVAAPPTPPEAPGDGSGCLGNFYRTNHFTANEKNIGSYTSVEACVQGVKEKCPSYDIANVPYDAIAGNGYVNSCWCQNSGGLKLADFANLDDGWGACRVKALADLEEAPPAPA